MKIIGTFKGNFGEIDFERELTQEELVGHVTDLAYGILHSRGGYEHETYLEEHAENLTEHLLEIEDVWDGDYELNDQYRIDVHLKGEDVEEAFRNFKASRYHAYLKKQEKIGRLIERMDDGEVMQKCLDDPKLYKKFKKLAKNF